MRGHIILYYLCCSIIASQDGSAKLWDISSRKCLATLPHNSSSEVLRATFLNSSDSAKQIVTAGADGHARVWVSSSEEESSVKYNFTNVCDLYHGEDQIYACEAIDRGCSRTQFITAAGSDLCLWETDCNIGRELHRYKFNNDFRSSFGGPRNPQNDLFIFDTKPCQVASSSSFHCLAVAVSDGEIVNIPGRK